MQFFNKTAKTCSFLEKMHLITKRTKCFIILYNKLLHQDRWFRLSKLSEQYIFNLKSKLIMLLYSKFFHKHY